MYRESNRSGTARPERKADAAITTKKHTPRELTASNVKAQIAALKGCREMQRERCCEV